MSIRQVLTTVLAGTHAAGLMLAQGYGDYYGLRRAPRFIPPHEYSRPYRPPFHPGPQDRDLYYPSERSVNRDFHRFESYDWRTPYRPY